MSWFSFLFTRKPRSSTITQTSSSFKSQQEIPTLPTLGLNDESGRRYRDDTPYMLPKDMEEINRLDFQHFALRSSLQGNYLAPINKSAPPMTILDVGSGSGIWGYEMCKEFPGSQIFGFDLEALKDNPPANYHFHQGNLLEGLPFEANSMDYIHQRLLMGALPATAWPEVTKEMARVIRPGGWVELFEVDGDCFVPAGPVGRIFIDNLQKVALMRGIDILIGKNLDNNLKDAGLINVVKRQVDLPLGDWAGRIGSLMKKDLIPLFYTFRDPFMRTLNISSEKFDEMHATMIQEWESYHPTTGFYSIIGQKPV